MYSRRSCHTVISLLTALINRFIVTPFRNSVGACNKQTYTHTHGRSLSNAESTYSVLPTLPVRAKLERCIGESCAQTTACGSPPPCRIPAQDLDGAHVSVAFVRVCLGISGISDRAGSRTFHRLRLRTVRGNIIIIDTTLIIVFSNFFTRHPCVAQILGDGEDGILPLSAR